METRIETPERIETLSGVRDDGKSVDFIFLLLTFKLMKLLPIPFDLLVSGSMRYTLGYGRSGIPPTVCARLSN